MPERSSRFVVARLKPLLVGVLAKRTAFKDDGNTLRCDLESVFCLRLNAPTASASFVKLGIVSNL